MRPEILDLTIAIPVKNEEKCLAGCLQAIGYDLAKEIVIIDSGSTDTTRQIAAEAGVRVIDFVWNGRFPKKRNWFLRHHRPATKWVLFLDADEYLTPAFKKELRDTLKGDENTGFWLNYSIYFMGRKLKGGYPLKKLALFRVGAGEYEKIDEEQWSHLDMEVHEHPVLEGAIGEIKSKIDHLDDRGISHYINKHNEYASWEAARYMKLNSDVAAFSHFSWKQRLKYRLSGSVLIAPVYFLGCYFLMGGFRDGSRGFAFALLKMSYFIQVYCKIKEIKSMKSPKEPATVVKEAVLEKI
ncbi:MAG TPA: glycosyltransferase family 2 protein [Flavisolibacter sp.]|jgi:glycosyltransferase involved in cell wall biosynthesis|nr:glycosyltransferase family 2 protein [Flavisolibacter sp.]